MDSAQRVVKFPAERVARRAHDGATWWQIQRSRIREWMGRIMNRVGLPGAVQPIEIIDKPTGQTVAVTLDDFYVRLRVNGRDFYFDRITGRFDGTGSAGT